MQAVNCRACLAVGACGFTASRDELPYKGLGGNPFLIIASLEIAAVALITVKQGKPDSLFLLADKAFHVSEDAFFKVFPVFSGTPGWIQNAVSPSTDIRYL